MTTDPFLVSRLPRAAQDALAEELVARGRVAAKAAEPFEDRVLRAAIFEAVFNGSMDRAIAALAAGPEARPPDQAPGPLGYGSKLAPTNPAKPAAAATAPRAPGAAPGGAPSAATPAAPPPPAAPREPAVVVEVTADALGAALAQRGFIASTEKPGLWRKHGGRDQPDHYWDFRRHTRGVFYRGVVGGGIATTDDDAGLKQHADYLAIRALQDAAAGQTSLPAPAEPLSLPKAPPRPGLQRVWLNAPTGFAAALKGWGFQEAGRGYWWADMPADAVAKRVAWAKEQRSVTVEAPAGVSRES